MSQFYVIPHRRREALRIEEAERNAFIDRLHAPVSDQQDNQKRSSERTNTLLIAIFDEFRKPPLNEDDW